MKLKYVIRIVKFYCETLKMAFYRKVVELLQPFALIIIIIIIIMYAIFTVIP